MTSRNKVIYAFILREFKTRFGAQKMGYLWMFLEPLLHVVILSIVFGFAGRVMGGGIPYPIFVILGILPWLMFNNIISKGMSAVAGNRALLIYPPVKLIDPFLSRVLVEVIITTMVGTLIFLALPFLSSQNIINFEMNFKNLGLFVFYYMFFILFSASLSLVFLVLSEINESIKKVIAMITRPLYFLSGVFYSVNIVPMEYQWIFHYNPISNFLEAMRDNFFKSYSTTHYDLSYIFIVTTIVLFFGLYLYKYKLKRNLL